jgi:hypothetical protein
MGRGALSRRNAAAGQDARAAEWTASIPLLAFALTALIIEITPGPNMTYLAALSLSSGIRTGFAAVAGIAIGLMTYGVVAALGLAAVIDGSPVSLRVLRWGGVGVSAVACVGSVVEWNARPRPMRLTARTASPGLPSAAG